MVGVQVVDGANHLLHDLISVAGWDASTRFREFRGHFCKEARHEDYFPLKLADSQGLCLFRGMVIGAYLAG